MAVAPRKKRLAAHGLNSERLLWPTKGPGVFEREDGESQTLTLFVNDSYQEFGPDAERAAFSAAVVLMMIAVLFIVLIALLRPKEKS